MSRIDDDALARMVAAVAEVDQEAVASVVAPPFDVALAPRLAQMQAAQRAQGRLPEVVPAPGLTSSWRLATSVALFQRRLVAGVALGVVTLVGLAAAVVLSLVVPAPAGARVFAAVVTLVVLLGAGAVCSARFDPRGELLAAMPISPVAVFAARLALVVGVEVIAALGASVAAGALGVPAGLGALVLGWLGPALLAASALVVVSVWRSAPLGAAVGAAVWLLGVAAGGAGGSAVGLGAVLAPLSATSGPALALAAALLAAALARIATSGPPRSA